MLYLTEKAVFDWECLNNFVTGCSYSLYLLTLTKETSGMFPIHIKPINNRWAWGMVPEGGAGRQAEPNVQGIHV